MKKAIVIGSGFAGLLAARILSDFFQEVVIVEKDDEPKTPVPRKGVPQGNHIHVLLNAGENLLEEFFPGIREQMVTSGSQRAVLGKDVKWNLAGAWMPEFDGGMATYFQSRPFLEQLLRQRVAVLNNVSFLYGKKRKSYGLSADGKTICSVVIEDVKDGTQEIFNSDLVVETAGSGTDLLDLLTHLGFPVPPESVVEPDFAYSSGIFEIPDSWSADWKAVLLYPLAPQETRAAAIVPIEGGYWMATAAGYCGDYPPTDLTEFIDFLKSLRESDVYDAVRSAKLVGNLSSFKFRRGVRRHFEALSSHPSGFVTFGDAICRANPFFGQGITVAALEARELQKKLSVSMGRGNSFSSSDIRDFYKEVAKILNVSWEMAVGEDFKYPQTLGKRPLTFPFTRWFKDKVMSANDPEVAKQFYKVMHFVDKPSKLLTPKILYRTFLRR